jgi:hypothetical protein
MAGMTMPAETTSMPSFIIALRDNFIVTPLMLFHLTFSKIRRALSPVTSAAGSAVPGVRRRG